MAIRVGFIGLGDMGKPMAEHLVAAGLETTVFDLRPEPVVELVDKGASAASSPRELAGRCDVISVCVRDDADTRDVAFGTGGILAGASAGAVVALHSTILPSTVREVAEAAQREEIGVIDACVTGGVAGARAGTLTYMVGGEAEHLEKCRPALEASGTRIVHAGEVGCGAAVKLCNNLMTYLAWLSAYEARHLALGAGLSEEALEEVTRASGNLTDPMLAFLALHRAPEATRRSEEFQARLLNLTTLAEKDLAATLAFARENGIALPGAGVCQQVMARVYGLNDEGRR